MAWVAVAVVGGSIITGYMGQQAASGAADTQAAASREAGALQAQTTREQLAQQQAMYDQNVERMQPWVQTGGEANKRLSDLMAPGGQLTKTFGPADVKSNLNPSYDFMLGQGMQQLQASAAARGGLLTGQGAKDINNYAQEYAKTGYQQAYENYVNNQNLLYNRLSGMSTTGENAAAGVGAQGTQVSGNMANTAMNSAQQIGGYMTGAANASAAGQIGTANAWNSAIGNGLNTYMGFQALNAPTAAPSTVPTVGGSSIPGMYTPTNYGATPGATGSIGSW